MPVSDPVADLLTRIRNANSANHETLDVDASKLKIEILRILHEEGYIKSYEVISQPVQDKIKVTLKYGARNREKVITTIKRKDRGRAFVSNSLRASCIPMPMFVYGS